MESDSLPERHIQIPRSSSVYDTFPPPQEDPETLNRCFEKAGVIEDGIEVVPIEFPNTPALSWSGKQVATGEDKEVVPLARTYTTISKPLPSIPNPESRCIWGRISLRYRIIILVCIQASMLLSTCLGVITVSRRFVSRSPKAEAVTAAPIPSSIPSLKSGKFLVMSGKPQQESSACLAQNNESAAWSCVIVAPVFQLSVLPPPADRKDMTVVSLTPLDNQTQYGLQPPQLDAVSLDQATDPEFPGYGPAYHFRTTYQRIVILNENQIIDQSEEIAPFDPNFMNIRLGERPWVCMFNETEIEGYIYASRLSRSAGGSQAWSFGDETAPMMPFLPYVMKITERRVNGTQPYCVQAEMKDDGRLVPAMKDGAGSMLRLKETTVVPGREAADSCRCQWLVE